ncbi:MAG: redoxin family protein, partial [Planctomycetota bacterium]
EVRFAGNEVDSVGMRKILVIRKDSRLELSIRQDGLLAAAVRIEEKNGVRERAEWVFSTSELGKGWPQGEKLPALPAGYTVRNLPGPFERLLPEGSPAPAAALQRLDGKIFHLADLRGRTVLLTFWFAQCGPCRAELPQVEAFWKAIQRERDDLVVLAVDLNDPPETVKQVWEKEGFTFPAVLQKEDEVSKAFGVAAYPTVYLIGPDGKILYRNLAFEEKHIRKRLPPPDRARTEARSREIARLQLENFGGAVGLFLLMQGRLPGSLQDLLRPDPGSGAPLMESIPKDPWGNDYFYQAIPDTHSFELLSFGADGKRGGTGFDADVVWNRKD